MRILHATGRDRPDNASAGSPPRPRSPLEASAPSSYEIDLSRRRHSEHSVVAPDVLCAVPVPLCARLGDPRDCWSVHTAIALTMRHTASHSATHLIGLLHRAEAARLLYLSVAVTLR